MTPALLADENISGVTIEQLRARGFDVVSVAATRPSSSDADVVALAVAEERWLLTFDADFGGLVFKQRLPAPPGIVYLRFIPQTPAESTDRIVEALMRYGELHAFVVVGRKGNMRMRSLPDDE